MARRSVCVHCAPEATESLNTQVSRPRNGPTWRRPQAGGFPRDYTRPGHSTSFRFASIVRDLSQRLLARYAIAPSAKSPAEVLAPAWSDTGMSSARVVTSNERMGVMPRLHHD